jgi:hypothetical protein
VIKLTYNDGCRLGNRLYMYAAGRLLAKKLGMAICSAPLEGFPITGVYSGPNDGLNSKEWSEWSKEFMKVNGADPIPTWPDVNHLNGQDIEIEHGFVNSRYFVNDRDLIREWFWSEPPMEVDPESVLVNVRLREFTPLGLTLHPSYYTTVLERMSFKKLYLMTDDPGNPYLDIFAKHNPIPVTGYGPEHFFKALAFKRIVMSNSTFCWWFTFVSKATEIYLPMLNGHRCGSWCLSHLPAIDLRLDWPEVTTVYNIPNLGPLPVCSGPTDMQRAEALAFGKQSKTLFLGDRQ